VSKGDLQLEAGQPAAQFGPDRHLVAQLGHLQPGTGPDEPLLAQRPKHVLVVAGNRIEIARYSAADPVTPTTGPKLVGSRVRTNPRKNA
jgi:hypothetical protein